MIERIQTALILFGNLMGAAYCLGMVLAYWRRTWGRK